MTILGIGGILNDAAAAILKDGNLAAAVEEQKVGRQRTTGELPKKSIETCLQLAQVSASEVDCVALVRPFGQHPQSDLHLEIRAHFPTSRLVIVEHHPAHAPSAFCPSPSEDATVLTLHPRGCLS